MTVLDPDRDSFGSVVSMLSNVARLRDGDGNCDFADFLARALASTAANVGGPDQLLAGRAGSWEADIVRSLLLGTLGDDAGDWIQSRTEPLVVPLNVSELIEDGQHPGLLGLDGALDARDERHLGTADNDDAYEVEIDEIADRYTDEYRRYGERFSEAVTAAVKGDGLTVAVRVEVDVDPLSAWWANDAITNPDPYDGDHTVLQLWETVHDVAALPNVDVEWPGRR